MYRKEQLIRQLQEMGICSSDIVLIHTSMKAIGDVEGGADGVIDTFCQYLCDGLFLVPTHTWGTVVKHALFYDVKTAVPCIGALPRAAALRTDGVRSLHPTHSVWAHGKDAAAFVRGEERATTPCPPSFLWDRLADVGAKILLLGVGLDKNTFIHAIDERADLPDRLASQPYDITIMDADGVTYTHPFAGHACSRSSDVSRQFVNFETPLFEMGAMRYGTFGNATVRIVDAKKCRDVIMTIYARATEDLCVEFREIPRDLYR